MYNSDKLAFRIKAVLQGSGRYFYYAQARTIDPPRYHKLIPSFLRPKWEWHDLPADDFHLNIEHARQEIEDFVAGFNKTREFYIDVTVTCSEVVAVPNIIPKVQLYKESIRPPIDVSVVIEKKLDL